MKIKTLIAKNIAKKTKNTCNLSSELFVFLKRNKAKTPQNILKLLQKDFAKTNQNAFFESLFGIEKS